MPVYVALLRGVNVGKSRRVAMADLRTAVEGLGYEDVTTHIQTGNVVLRTSERSADKVGRAIERAVSTDLGLDIDVVVRTAQNVAGSNPFGAHDPKQLHVAFLKSKPAAAAARALGDTDFGRDEFVLRGAELYLRYPDGYGRSKMTAAVFERELRVPMTVRNWNVTTKLAELAASAAGGR